MNIETKFEIGEEVYYLDVDNKPFPAIKKMFINKIVVLLYQEKNVQKSLYIYYNGWEVEQWEQIPEKLKEEHLFRTKEELTNNL